MFLVGVRKNGVLTVPRTQLGNRSGLLLAETLSSPPCALRELIVAENSLSDSFVEALSEGMRDRVGPSQLRSLDASGNKICDRWVCRRFDVQQQWVR